MTDVKQASPKSVGLSSERLENFDLLLKEKYVDKGKLPGAQILIARGGKVAHFSSLGMRDIENNLPVEEDTIFRIYSMTKPVTGVALMQLFEKGLFQLSDPVSKFLPEFKEQSVYISGKHPLFLTKPVEREMNIRDLLTHTSGLSYSINYRSHVDSAYRDLFDIEDPTKWIMTKEEVDLEEFTKRIASIPLEHSPGTQWLYSVSIDVCARLIEVMTGKPVREYFKENIFDPLEMKYTDFHTTEENSSKLAACYMRDVNKKLILQDSSGKESKYAEKRSFQGGGSGLVSTSLDYYKFLQMLLNGGEPNGTSLLSRKTIELMTMNHLPDNQTMADMNTSGSFSEVRFQGMGYGLSMAVTTDPASSQSSCSKGSFNWGGMASTSFWVDPKEELIGLFMTQLIPSDAFPLRPQMQSMIYGSFID